MLVLNESNYFSQGLKPFHCELCPRKFNEKTNLKVHHLACHSVCICLNCTFSNFEPEFTNDLSKSPGEEVQVRDLCKRIWNTACSSTTPHRSLGKTQCQPIGFVVIQFKLFNSISCSSRKRSNLNVKTVLNDFPVRVVLSSIVLTCMRFVSFRIPIR